MVQLLNASWWGVLDLLVKSSMLDMYVFLHAVMIFAYELR